MAQSKSRRFDAADMITNELIKLIEKGVTPWRQPWKGNTMQSPLRHNGEPYNGVNIFLLTIRANLEGFASPFWMTYNQAKELGGQVRKGQKATTVVFYGTTSKEDDDDEDAKVIPFLKSYRVFNADQIDELPERFYPAAVAAESQTANEPIPHLQAFFDAIPADTRFTGREAYYMPATDRIYMPELSLFENPHHFYSVWSHELAHWTKAPTRLNRSYGASKFGNTAYAREEVTAELTALIVGQRLGFAPHTIELSAAYLGNWLHVLKSDKRAIFRQAADAQRACDYLCELSEAGRGAGEGDSAQNAA